MYLKQLSNAFGVSSVEGDVRKIIIEAIKPHADSWQVDTMGNLFVTRQHRAKNSTSPLKVMVTAHMDEVGFIISEIKSSGLLKFKPIGGFDRRVLLGKSVVVGPDKIPGVIGLKPIHLLGSDYNKVGSIDSMYIDVGATSDANCPVSVGQFATFTTQFEYLGGLTRHRKDRGLVKGKALDNRVGCAMLIELLNGDYPVDLTAVFTVQEEIGLRGARVASYRANPAVAFILECTAADDLPRFDDEDDNGEEGSLCLGDGPAITLMDRTFIANRSLVDLLTQTAEAHAIPYQFKRPGIGGTDAGTIHKTRAGVASAVVSVPARYIHAPAAIIDLVDFWNCIKLMQATLENINDLRN